VINLAGINEVRARLEPEEFAMLNEGMVARRLFRPAYDLPEYIALLIRQDNLRLKEQLAEMGKQRCGKCGDTLPGDPNGCCLRGETVCWQTKLRPETSLKALLSCQHQQLIIAANSSPYHEHRSLTRLIFSLPFFI
jgi:hypothetical protein